MCEWNFFLLEYSVELPIEYLVKLLTYEDRLEQLNLCSLQDRCTRTNLMEVFKIIHGLSSVRLITYFELDLGVTWVCIHDLTWHQNDLKVN